MKEENECGGKKVERKKVIDSRTLCFACELTWHVSGRGC
jgi:hypothetical protein